MSVLMSDIFIVHLGVDDVDADEDVRFIVAALSSSSNSRILAGASVSRLILDPIRILDFPAWLVNAISCQFQVDGLLLFLM